MLMSIIIVVSSIIDNTRVHAKKVTMKYGSTSKTIESEKNLENMWAFFTTDKKYTEEATAGIIGNAIVESGLNTKAVSKSGYTGIFQWDGKSNGRWEQCKTWCEKKGYDYYSVKGQCERIVEEMKADFGDGTSSKVSYKDFKKLTDVQKASDQFMMYIERCIVTGKKTGIPENYQHYKDRRNMSAAVYKKYTGKTITFSEGGSTTTEASKTTSGGGVTGGSSSLLDEGHFIATERPLHEKEVKLADGSDLTYDEKKNLEMLKDANDKSFLTEAISLLRAIIMFIGIIMTVYCIFFYLIYWFDRVNSLMDFSLLKVISFGKVQTSMDDESSYGTDIEGTKEVNHGDVLRICIIGLMLGMLLATGRLFKIASLIQGIVDWFLTAVLG